LEGWISDRLWQDIRPHLSNPNPSCRTDVVLLDSALFPVRRDFEFVCGPPGAIGVTNLEFRAFSHPTERRMVRRAEPRF
jgi:transposase